MEKLNFERQKLFLIIGRKQTLACFSIVIVRNVFNSGLYSSQDSIKMSLFWNRTVFKSGLYSSQASISELTVILKNNTFV